MPPDFHPCVPKNYAYVANCVHSVSFMVCITSRRMCTYVGQVLTMLAGQLITAKARVGTAEGMLPLAELTLSMSSECPGLLRCGGAGERGRR